MRATTALPSSTPTKWRAISVPKPPTTGNAALLRSSLPNNAALALLDKLDQLADLFARFDFRPHRFDCLASVQFRSVKQPERFLDRFHAFRRKSRAFHSDQIDPTNFRRITVRDQKGGHVLDNLGAAAGDGEPTNSAKLMHCG